MKVEQHAAAQPVKDTLRVLLVDDSESDALLVLRELRRSGYDPISERVETAPAMRAALSGHDWDVILSDYVIPGFGGLEALAIAKDSGLDLPFILLSNKVSEETLVEAMRAGAADFIMKGRLGRLGPVVRRELTDAAARRGLKQAQIEWGTAFNAVQDAIFIHDADFRIVRANRAYAALGGLPITQLIGKPYWEVFPKRDGPLPGCRRVFAEGGMAQEQIDCADGTTLTSRSFAIIGASGRPTFSVHVMQDVTEHKRVEEALAGSERRHRKMIEKGADAFFLLDRAGTVTYRSESGKRLTGWDNEEVIGKNLVSFVPPESLPRARQVFAEVLADSNAVTRTELCILRKDGTPIDLEVFATNLLDDPDVGSIVVVAHDICERIREAQRTAALLGLSESAPALDERTLLQQGLDTMQRLTNSRIGFLHFVSEDQNGIELVTWTTDTMASYCQAAFDRHYPVSAAGIWADNIRLKQPIVINDYAAAPGKKGLPQGHPVLQRFISVPLIDDELVRMIVGVGNAASDYGERDVETVKLFSYDLYRMVQRKRAEDQIKLYVKQLETAFMSTVEVATNLSEMRDPYTAGHERRVAEIAVAIGAAIGFGVRRQEGLRVAGLLHDVGKITIPAEVLSKPTRLTEVESLLVKEHAMASYNVLKDLKFPWPVAEVALQHHERMDGSGYPQGLKGDAILLEARIMSVADVVEAMASHRPYRPGLGIDKALAEIERGRGIEYDLVVADACLKLFREKGYAIPA